MIQMGKVFWRNCKKHNILSTKTHKDDVENRSSKRDINTTPVKTQLTISVTTTEATLDSTPTINKLHVRVHVCLTTVTAYRSQLAQVNYRQRTLEIKECFP